MALAVRLCGDGRGNRSTRLWKSKRRERSSPDRSETHRRSQGANVPFIRGRFYANPIAGEALEAAREAEGAGASDGQNGANGDDDTDSEAVQAPFRRIEIHATELVPAHTGSGQIGYVARVYREEATGKSDESSREAHVFYEPAKLLDFLESEVSHAGAKPSGVSN
jgi:hypothetical protein